MRSLQEAYIVAAQRTPVGKAPKGQLSQARPDDLLAHVLREVVAVHPQLDKNQIDDVIVGCARPEAEQGLNVARISSLLAGFPHSVAGVTVNRFCASGLQAVAWAADKIRQGEADIMIGAGVESLSQVTMMGNKPAMNPAIFTDENTGIAFGMGLTAENVAQRWHISREAQDQFAFQSHQKAIAAIEAGHFNAEISPYPLTLTQPHATGGVSSHIISIDTDEGARTDTDIEKLAQLRSIFTARGTVTAGNTSQTSDGAAAVLLMSERMLKALNITPLARFVGFAVAGVAPEVMGIGPVEAVPKVLKQTGMQLSQMDWIELNEAFAAQSLAVIDKLAIDPSCINPCGGAIALGHPLGATGAIRTTSLVHGLQRTQQRYGMVTMCVGTGMGAAGIFERM